MRKPRLTKKFLEQRVHGLKAVRVARVISQQDVVLQEENVVFSAVEKDQPVLHQFIERSKIFAEERPPRFGNDIIFDVREHLRNLLAYTANDSPPRGLQFRQARLDHVRLLAAFEVFASLADPFLAFQDQVGELIGQFLT